ncbi:MAG: hypothetical protein J6K28_07920 [Alistipes sp.]|nr:hypothetical protein [Alistipes sp.]
MKRIISTLAAILVWFAADAQLALPKLVSDNMVLQRETEVRVWGWGAPKAKVKIDADWLAKPVTCVCDDDGCWERFIATAGDTDTHSMTVSSRGERITVGGILFGEVWFCAGQSNMSMPLRGYRNQPVENSENVVAASDGWPQVRMFTVAKKIDRAPRRDVMGGSWVSASSGTTAEFSAIGYMFARELCERLKVPVGMINMSMGGSNVQAWVSRDLLAEFPEVAMRPTDLSSKAPQREQCGLYNSMVHPSIGYTAKGAIWYQGENNIYTPDLYARMLPAMIGQWRELSGNADMPFYMVEIAPYRYKNDDAGAEAEDAALLREAQHAAVACTANTDIVCAADLGELRNIHPPKKYEIAERLAAVALTKSYGFEGIVCTFPAFAGAETDGDTMKVRFDNVCGGLHIVPYGGFSGFRIAGDDMVFRDAEAETDGNIVKLRCDGISEPKYVRYGFRNDSTATLFDAEGRPAFPFRSDN